MGSVASIAVSQPLDVIKVAQLCMRKLEAKDQHTDPCTESKVGERFLRSYAHMLK